MTCECHSFIVFVFDCIFRVNKNAADDVINYILFVKIKANRRMTGGLILNTIINTN